MLESVVFLVLKRTLEAYQSFKKVKVIVCVSRGHCEDVFFYAGTSEC